MTRTLPAVLLALFLLPVCAAPAQARNISYPIVLVHGLGEKPGRWEPLSPALQALGLQAGGVITRSRLLSHPPPADYDPQADYFLVEFDDNQGAVLDQLRELRMVLARLKRDTGADRFVLVGFSLGGLVSRAYLTRYRQRHYVEKLVTLGAPHQGSHWALFYELFQPVKRDCGSGTALAEIALCAVVAGLEQALDLRLDSAALRDLEPPRWDASGKPLNLTAELAIAPHPGDVGYVSIVGAVDLPSDWDELMQALDSIGRELGAGELDLSNDKARLFGLARHLLGLLLQYPDWQGRGDGGVSAFSQDLSQLPWFRDRITGHTTVDQGGIDVQHYNVSGLERPLRVETIDIHHLAQPAAFNALYRAIADAPRMELDAPPRWTWLSRFTLTGELTDALLQPDQLQLRDAGGRVLPYTPQFDDDRRRFRFEDLPLTPGDNRFELHYGVDHGFAVPADALQRRIAVEYRPNRLMQALYDRRWWLLALAALLLLAIAQRRIRKRN